MHTIIRCLHILTMVIVLGGYLFLSVFWWPVLQRTLTDVAVQVRCLSHTLRRFFTVVLLALTLELLTGGLYLLPAARTATTINATQLTSVPTATIYHCSSSYE